MLVGRKNCRKIVQFLVEPLMKKQSISQQGSGFFLYPVYSDRDPVGSFCVSDSPS